LAATMSDECDGGAATAGTDEAMTAEKSSVEIGAAVTAEESTVNDGAAAR
jgi:hypothetical protein